PSPTGPYGIGRIGYHWTDASRPDDYDPKLRRELMVYFWYPTAKSDGAKGQYFPGAAQMDALPEIHKIMSGEFGNAWALILSGEISSHAIEHAPIAKSGTSFQISAIAYAIDQNLWVWCITHQLWNLHGL